MFFIELICGKPLGGSVGVGAPKFLCSLYPELLAKPIAFLPDCDIIDPLLYLYLFNLEFPYVPAALVSVPLYDCVTSAPLFLTCPEWAI